MTDGDIQSTAPDPAPEPERGLLARARGHLMDLTPLRESRRTSACCSWGSQWATGPSFGELESGVVASIWSVPASVVSGGLLTILGVGLLGLFVPAFARYDAKHPVP